jgi:WD40 repeat protein/tetratricopeptide (TPR) repeat protein
MRAALQWARDSDLTLGLQLATALTRFWRSRAYLTEGRAWMEELLAGQDPSTGSGQALDPNPPDREVRANAIRSAAWLAADQHDFAGAERLLERSRALDRSVQETEDETGLLLNAGLQARALGQYGRAVRLVEDALARQRATGDRGTLARRGLGFSLYVLALVVREQGDFARAMALLEECIELHREYADREGMAQGRLGLGDVARDLGDAAGIRKHTEESLAVYREFGTQWATGFALCNLAVAAYLEGDLAQALGLIDDSVALFRRQKSDASLAEVLVTRGHILRARGEDVAAYEAFVEALRLAWVVGPRLIVVAALEGLAGVLAQRGEAARVAWLLGAMASLRDRISTPVRPVDQPMLEQARAAAQTALDAETFAGIWEAGSREPLEQILGTIPDVALFDAPLLLTAPRMGETGGAGSAPAPPVGPQVDWGDALAGPTFYGRDEELAVLSRWVVEERCRVVTLLGMGGIGKSALAVTLMHTVAGHFDVVLWRSLRDAPSFDTLLDGCLQVLAPRSPQDLPASLEGRLQLLMEQMRDRRVLLVLDNLETLLEEGTGTRSRPYERHRSSRPRGHPAHTSRSADRLNSNGATGSASHSGRIRAGAQGYARLLQRMGETAHRSCLLLTGREKPAELVPLEGSRSPVRSLRLAGLDVAAGVRLLAEKELAGSPQERSRLVEVYGGNPLALRIVSQTIIEVFGGRIAPFLEQGEVVFGGVRELLDEQFDRLSTLEQGVIYWLAIMREPANLEELLAAFRTPQTPAQVMEALEALRRRSLIEREEDRQQAGSFMLHPVVVEYAVVRLISEAAREIEEGRLVLLNECGLCQARAKEYVRQTQEQLLVVPLLARLRSTYPAEDDLQAHLLRLLDSLRGLPHASQRYGPANLVTLLRVMRVLGLRRKDGMADLRGLDLSRLALRDVYLQGVEMQDASLARSLVRDSLFTDAFDIVTDVAISANGAHWAAASARGEVLVWAAGGNPLHRVWRDPVNVVWEIALSPDGRTLAGGAWNGEIILRDIAGGEILWTAGRHTSKVNCLVFSPDGNMIASCGSDGTVRLWDRNNGSLRQMLSHGVPVPVIAWSPDGQLLAGGDVEGHIRLWQVNKSALGKAEGVCMNTLKHREQLVVGLAFSPDGRTLAGAGHDGTVQLWDLASGQLHTTMTEERTAGGRLAWSPDGRTLAGVGGDHAIRLWDVATGTTRLMLRCHTARVKGLAFTPDSLSLLTGSEDGTLRVWDVAAGHVTRVIQGYATSLSEVDWSPDGTQLISSGWDRLVTMYDATGDVPPRVFQRHNSTLLGVAWSPDGRTLASADWENSIWLWDPDSGALLQKLHHPDDLVNCFATGAAWSPDGHLLAVGTKTHGVLVWDSATHRWRWPAQPSPARISSLLAWSPDGRTLAGGSPDGVVHVIDAATGLVLHRLEDEEPALSGTGRSPELAKGKGRYSHNSTITSVAWSPDGHRLASGSGGRDEGEIIVWEVESEVQMRAIAEHSGIVYAVAWGRSGEVLISGGSDGILRWWNVESGECLREQRAHQGQVAALRRSPDGTRLASCGADGAVMLWDLQTGEHLRTLRRDRPYERLDITGVRGLTGAQKKTLLVLGAKEYDAPEALGTQLRVGD